MGHEDVTSGGTRRARSFRLSPVLTHIDPAVHSIAQSTALDIFADMRRERHNVVLAHQWDGELSKELSRGPLRHVALLVVHDL